MAELVENGLDEPKPAVIGQPATPPKDGVPSPARDAGEAASSKDASKERGPHVSEKVRAEVLETTQDSKRHQEALRALRAFAELAAILAFAYLCDRTKVFAQRKKVYDPRQFWGLWLALCVAALFTLKKGASDKAMPREQTDEWKGWMQIMFLMYHYFAEKEVYNAIRVYIAAYVWMTGYGNFYLYARRSAFSLRRLLHTLFRLNFLGFCMCVVLNNEYMLYYICAMHTLFTLFVMAMLYVKRGLNGSRWGVYAKSALVLALTVVLYDGPHFIFRAVFGTLPVVRPLLAFHDPVHPEFTDEMHEWHFRSGLDRFIWIAGMIAALHVDDFQSWLERVESLTLPRRMATYALAAASIGVVGILWWYYVFRRGKFDYNKLHPFTSAVPICIYLLLRNGLPALRRRHLGIFAHVGKYTLETYIFQFHIWMRTTGINGSPKHLLEWVPGYYWLNFLVVTAVYVLVSIRFFNLTAVLSETLIRKEPRELAAVVVCIAAGSAACLGASRLFVSGG